MASWQPQPTAFCQASPELHINDESGLSAMIRGLAPPHAVPAPFAQPPAVPSQPQMQPTMRESQFCFGHWTSAATPVHAAAPLAAAHSAVPVDAPPEEPAKPARRRRGRPRGSTSAASKRGANTAAAAAACRQRAPCTHPAATPGEGKPLDQQPAPTSAIALHDGEPGNERKREEAMDAGGETGGEEEEAEYADTSAPGVRFQPSDEEIIGYLRTKYLPRRKMHVDIVKVFDVYKDPPYTVQEKCGNSVDGSWYVFSSRSRKYDHGSRPARSVRSVGYWKSNNKETPIVASGRTIGVFTILTFFIGRQPKGVTTPWRMKEYRIPEYQQTSDGLSMLLDEWVICKLFCTNEAKLTAPLDIEDQSSEVDVHVYEADGDGDGDTMVNRLLNNDFGVNEENGDGDGDTTGNKSLNSSEQYLSVENYVLSDFAFAPEDYWSD